MTNKTILNAIGFLATFAIVLFIACLAYKAGIKAGNDAVWKKIGHADSVIWHAALRGQDSVATMDVWLYGHSTPIILLDTGQNDKSK